MSFSKAKSKRFHEIVSCAPPVGKYDVDVQDKATVNRFDKSERFKIPKEPQHSILHNSTSMDSLLFYKTPVKLFDSVLGGDVKTRKSSTPLHNDMDRKIAGLEREIRHLLQKCTDQEKLLNTTQHEVKKYESRLQCTLQEKSGLEAGLATAEKKLSNLMKSKEMLKNKVDSVDHTVEKKQEQWLKQVHEARRTLDYKEKEFTFIQDKLTCKVHHLQADLEEASTKISALEETNKVQEQLKNDVQKHSEDTEKQISQLHSLTDQLRSENVQSKERLMVALSEYESLSSDYSLLKGTAKQLEEEVHQAKTALHTERSENESKLSRHHQECENQIADLRLQLMTDNENKMEVLNKTVQSTAQSLEEKTMKAEEAVGQVAKLNLKLQTTESMMNDNLQALSIKYQLLEEDHKTCKKEREQEMLQLQFELEAVYSTSSELEAECDGLRKSSRELLEGIDKQREIGILLQGQLDEAEQTMMKTEMEHQEYKEKANTDLQVLIECKNNMTQLNTKLKDRLESLHSENELIHADLSRHSETFEQMTKDKSVLLNKMSELCVQKEELQEELTTLLLDSEKQKMEIGNLVESKMNLEKEMSEKLESSQEDMKKMKQEFGKRLVETQTRCSMKEAEVHRLSQQIDALKESFQNTLDESNKFQQLTNEMQQEKTALYTKISELDCTNSR